MEGFFYGELWQIKNEIGIFLLNNYVCIDFGKFHSYYKFSSNYVSNKQKIKN